MNIVKSDFINARTKSLREKFSRNRSYSELSFKDSNTNSSLVSTPTESCSGSLNASLSQTHFVSGSLKRQQRSIHGHPTATTSTSAANNVPSSSVIYNAEPYCSAFDLSAPMEEEPRFPWQRDAAIQCDLIKAPSTLPVNLPTTSAITSRRPNANKKKISTSSTSSAASTLINAAAATLRMTGLGHDSSNSSSQSGNGGNRFWKSSLLLPSFNVGGACNDGYNSENHGAKGGGSRSALQSLRRQKSQRWTSSIRRPALKRAVSFDSRGGYARLVQSTSSPSSPPDDNDQEVFIDASPRASADSDCQLLPKHKGSLDEDSSSVRRTCNSDHAADGTNVSRLKFWHSSALATRATAMLGASAAMTAAAPFTSVKSPSKSTNDTPSTSASTRPSTSEVIVKEVRRKQFVVSRKQPSSAPDSFDDAESTFVSLFKCFCFQLSTFFGSLVWEFSVFKVFLNSFKSVRLIKLLNEICSLIELQVFAQMFKHFMKKPILSFQKSIQKA